MTPPESPASRDASPGALGGARIVLAVSGGIAAYKAIEVCRRLIDLGAHVAPVLTEDALRFVTKLTFDALASELALTSLWDGPGPSPHTRLGQSADLIVVAPATARVLAKYAAGISDDLLTATLLATRSPVLVCPAMHTEMWEHPATQDNMATLARRGVHIEGPAVGPLASGDYGAGRLVDPAQIVAAAARVLAARTANDCAGLRVLVTAGGTREAIDPVRFIGNRSSGKQGYAIAAEALARGASVTLVSTAELTPPPGAAVVRVESATQMQAACESALATHDVVVMSAAVADFRPVHVANQKLKKGDDGGVPSIVLERTPDILAGMGAKKQPGQIIVGFAAETHDLVANAMAKLTKKRVDLIVANDVSAPGVGFSHDTNAVTIFGADGSRTEVALADKRHIAKAVLDAVLRVRAGEAAGASVH